MGLFEFLFRELKGDKSTTRVYVICSSSKGEHNVGHWEVPSDPNTFRLGCLKSLQTSADACFGQGNFIVHASVATLGSHAICTRGPCQGMTLCLRLVPNGIFHAALN